MLNTNHTYLGWICGVTVVTFLMLCMTIPSVSANDTTETNHLESAAGIAELYANYRSEQSLKIYLNVRRMIIADSSYSPYLDNLHEIERLLIEAQHEKALNLIKASQPDLLLSPRAHLMASATYKELHQDSLAADEFLQAELCVKGIISTGKGTMNRPYQVLRIADEYDVLGYLGKSLDEQSTHETENQVLDVMKLTDGSTIVFDVTTMRLHMARLLKEQGLEWPDSAGDANIK